MSSLSSQEYVQIAAAGFLITLQYLGLGIEVHSLLPMVSFFYLCCGSCSNGNCPACCSQGGSSSSSGSSSSGSSSSGSSSSGSSSSGSSSGGSSSSGSSSSGSSSGPSTPFAYVWDGVKYVMDNDVMFGKPTSRFSDLTDGKEQYIQGKVTPDSYILQNEVSITDGRVRIQIKEIEPEKSSIDFIELTGVSLNQNQVMFTKSDFSNQIIIDKSKVEHDLVSSEITIRSSVSGYHTNLTTDFSNTYKRSGLTFNSGDWLEVEFTRSDTESTQYLLLDSWFRDWMLGELYVKDHLVSPVGYWIKLFSTAAVSTLVAFIGFFNPFTSSRTHQQGNDLLLGSYGSPRAHAEVPNCQSCISSSGRSLVVSSFDKQRTTFNILEVVEPRYVKSDTVAVAVPNTAYDETDTARLRIEATKRHKISGIGIVSVPLQSENTQVARVSLPLIKATLDRTGEECSDVLAVKRNGKYVDTLPGDVLTLEFDASALKDSENRKFVLSVGGIYSYASENDQYLAGDWVNRLDTTAKKFIKETYIQSR